MRYVLKHWRGDLPLAISFWVNFVLINLIFQVFEIWLVNTASFEHPVISSRFTILFIAFLLLFIYPWQIVGLWRSSSNYVEENKVFWPRIVQFLIVVGVLATLGNLVSSMQLYKDLFKVGFLNDRFEYNVKLINDHNLMHLEGGFGFGVSKEVDRLLKENQNVKGIILDSSGGRVYEGRELSKLILTYGLDTYSIKGCYSSCVVAFISGNRRYLAVGANLGFHQYSSEFKSLEREFNIEVEQSKDLSFFKQRGVSQAFLDKVYIASSDEFWFPSSNEMISAGFIHELFHPSFFNSAQSVSKISIENPEMIPMEDLIEGFKYAAKQLKRNLPMMIDEHTRLDNVSVGPGPRIVYEYMFPNFFLSGVDVDLTHSNLKKEAVKNACSNPEIKKSLQSGGILEYSYSTTDGHEISSFEVERKTCGF